MYTCMQGLSNHWNGIRSGLEWNGMILNSEIQDKHLFPLQCCFTGGYIGMGCRLLASYFCLKMLICILIRDAAIVVTYDIKFHNV